MANGYKTGGRKKGTSNATTRSAKEAIAMAAEKLGGVDRLVSWAKEDPQNEKAFWASVYPKLIPVTISGDEDNPLVTVTEIRLTALK